MMNRQQCKQAVFSKLRLNNVHSVYEVPALQVVRHNMDPVAGTAATGISQKNE